MSKRLSPLRAIRAKCLDCSAGNAAEVGQCGLNDCPLYRYRMGHNPARAGKGGSTTGRGRIGARKTVAEFGNSGQEQAKDREPEVPAVQGRPS